MSIEDTSRSTAELLSGKRLIQRARHLQRSTGSVPASIPYSSRSLRPADLRFLLDATHTRVACFEFFEPLDTELPRTQFVDSVWATPSACLTASGAFAADLGFADRAALEGIPFSGLFPANAVNFDIINTWYSNGLSDGPIVARVTLPDGALRFYHFYFHAQLDETFCSRLWIVARDVTRQRQALVDLQHAEEHYRTLVERPGLILLRTSAEGMVLYVSPHVQTLLGYSPRDFEKRPALIHALLHPDDTERYARLVNARKNRDIQTTEAEYRVRFLDGTYHWIFERQTPKVRPDDSIEYYDSVILDIQEKKQLESQLLHMQRMETIGSLTGGLAHDFNNYLAAILGQLSLAREKLPEDHPAYRSISLAEQATLNCSAMSRRLLSFGRTTESQKKPIATFDFLESTERLLRHAVPTGIQTNLHVPQEVYSILGNYTELQQVLLNLGINARDAMPDGGTIAIRARNVICNGKNDHWPNAAAGRYIEIQVTDTGSGIPAAHLEFIFDPYFTTKDAENGSGLGLSLAYSIVQAHDGYIHVDSVPESGSSFLILIPAVEVEPEPATTDAESAPGGSELVLVVDDDPLVLAMVQAALSNQGYSVLAAGSADEAMTLFEVHRGTIALVMIDYSMQATKGDVVARAILEQDSQFPILLTSGYGRNLFDIPVHAEFVDFLAKPYPVSELLHSVRQLLDLASNGK